jgi:hypothetical protein
MMLLLIGCLGALQTKKIQSWDEAQDLPAIIESIDKSKYGYQRELALKQLTAIPSSQWSKETHQVLIKCVENNLEHPYIRAQCATVIGLSPSDDAVESIIAAMDECDNESRYWMLIALENFATLNPLARGQISESQHDPDIFISTEAKRWLEENQ